MTVVAPSLGLMAAIGVIAAVAAPDVLRVGSTNPDLRGIGSGVLPALLLVAFVLSYALMAILWHRPYYTTPLILVGISNQGETAAVGSDLSSFRI